MANVEEAVGGDATPPLLPNPPHLSFALLQQMARPGDAMVLVALQLMQRVAGRASLITRRYTLDPIEVRRRAKQGAQFEQLAPLLVLLVPYRLQLHAQLLDVRPEVSNRFQSILEIAAERKAND